MLSGKCGFIGREHGRRGGVGITITGHQNGSPRPPANAKMREPVSPELLRRIRAGLRDSDFTPNGVRHFYGSLGIEKDFR